jgi:hypothetical protein
MKRELLGLCRDDPVLGFRISAGVTCEKPVSCQIPDLRWEAEILRLFADHKWPPLVMATFQNAHDLSLRLHLIAIDRSFVRGV